jgi:hypothetical protein
METMVTKGFDVNTVDGYGNSVLAEVLYQLIQQNECCPQPAFRYDVVKQLLLWGANPNGQEVLSPGPLVWASMGLDYEMTELLLEAGADVNATRIIRLEPETVYDSAEFEYRYAVWYDLMECEDETFRGDEDEWLQGLDRAARKLGRCRPWLLRLLRDRGALSYREIF